MTYGRGRTVSRIAQAGLAVALLMVLTACQESGSDQKPAVAAKSAVPSGSPWTCGKGTVHWGEARQQQRLVAVSQLVRSTKETKGTSVRFSAIPVRTVTAAVKTSATVALDEETLLASLEKELGLESGTLARFGKSVPLPGIEGNVSVTLTGQEAEYASAVGATGVEASFVYGCASSTRTPVYGTITTWYKPIAGMLECGTDPKKAYAREAYTLLCGEQATSAPSASATSSS